MDTPLLAQAAALLYEIVSQRHPEPCSLDVIDTTTRALADEVGHLTAQSWAEAVVGAAEATRPRCGCGAEMRAERRPLRAVLLLVGLLRLKVRRFRCPACGAWECPGTQVLGLGPRARMTAAVQEFLCEMGLSWGYKAAAIRAARRYPGGAVSAKTIERLTKQVGAEVAAREEAEAAKLEAASLAAAEAALSGREEPAPKAVAAASPPFGNPARIYLALDGILVRGRRAKERLEIQVGSLWSAWKWRSGCNPPRREIEDKTFVARAEGWERLGPQVWRWFVARGGRCAPGREVVVLGDGASGIRSLWELYFPKALVLLDPWHLWEKVKVRAREVLRDRERAVGAAQVVYRRLQRGALAEARELIEHWPATTEWALQQRARLLAYLERNADTIRNYEDLRSKGYMVGGGLTEKSNELVVTPRMKNGKMHWSRGGADAVALLRARVLTDPAAPVLPI
jgi:hypothetical protein